MCAPALCCCGINGLIERCVETVVTVEVTQRSRLRCSYHLYRPDCFRSEYLGIDKAVTGVDEGSWRLLLAKAIDREAIFSDACGKTCKVAITGNETKAA